MTRLTQIISSCFTGALSQGATGHASTPATPSRNRFPAVDGMPASLGTRRSSGPPAPRATSFDQLPADALGIVARKLSEGPRAEAGRNLLNASLTNKALQAAVVGDEHARHRLLQAPLVSNARKLIEQLLSGPPEEARLCLPVLGLLDRREQATLVQALTGHAGKVIHGWDGVRNPFKQFAPHLAELDKPLHAELVEQAIRYQDDEAAANAIRGLGGGLAHLDAALIDRLVHKATTLLNEQPRVIAIRGLSAGCGHMNRDQRQRLWQATMDIQVNPGVAIAGLGAQLKHLLPHQREQVFERAIHLPDAWNQAIALTGLAASIEVLDQGQRETLFAQGLRLPNGIIGERKEVVCALAAGVEHMTPGQRERLVGAIRKLGSTLDTARAMAALGPRLNHLAPEQQDLLLEAVAHLSNYGKSIAVAGMAAGLPALEPARRDKVAAIVLGMNPGSCMAETIGALGPHLEHLNEGLRNAVVEQASRLLSNYAIRCAVSPDDIRVLTAGLGAGMEALRGDQRDKLVTAVAAMDSHSSPNAYDFRQLPTIAAAIAGLASGQQHLSEASVAALVKAAANLESELETGAYNFSSERLAESKAIAIFGLVKA